MRSSARFSFIAVLALCACGGGGSNGTTTPIPQNANANTSLSDARSVQLGSQPISAALPVVSQITGTLFFPAVTTPTTLELSASATAPAGVALESVRRMQQQSGSLTVYEYFTLVPARTVTLPNIPAVTLNFPATTPLTGKSFSYGISDLNAQGGLVSFDTQGPGTLSGQTVSFALVPTPITFVAGHRYTFVVYATTSAANAGTGNIYVANFGQPNSHNPTPASVTSYTADGTPNKPTITASEGNYFFGIAIDTAGKIYVSNTGSLTTYKTDGTPTTPTITAGLNGPLGVAVDAAGKIYVANAVGNTLTTYAADGAQSLPTITAGLDGPEGVAVDAAGKIYVANIFNNTVTTYNADGRRTTPTIAAGLNAPDGVAVDAAGKIYVANQANSVTTYEADGSRTTPTITTGLDAPAAVAVDAAGKIYVANYYGNTVTTYNADGNRTTPTITGLVSPTGIAVH